MKAAELMDAHDIVADIEIIAAYLRAGEIWRDEVLLDVMAEDLERASDLLTNLIERLRLS